MGGRSGRPGPAPARWCSDIRQPTDVSGPPGRPSCPEERRYMPPPTRPGSARKPMNRLAPVRATVQRPYRISLPAGSEAAAEARRHVWAIIHAWDIPIDAYGAALLASELVANAMRQDTDGHEAVQLMISWVDGQLRVEVHEGSRSDPAPVPVAPRRPTRTPGAASPWSATHGGVTCASATGPSRPGKETDDHDGASPRDSAAPVPNLICSPARPRRGKPAVTSARSSGPGTSRLTPTRGPAHQRTGHQRHPARLG